MAYKSNLGGVPVYDDSNFAQLLAQASDITKFGSGYIARNFEARPFGSIVRPYTGPVFDMKELKERIIDKEAQKSGLAEMHRKLGIPILDQGQYGYCWMFGTVAAMMMAYAKNGGQVPFLSAASAAAKGKNYRNEGGLAEEALRYIEKYGVSTTKYWPDGGVADRKYDTPEQRANAALHKAVEFEELPSMDLMALASALVVDLPCTGGFAHWGHLVALAQPRIMPDGSIGIEFPNSWRKTWGKNGWGILAGKKAYAFEVFCIRTVTVTSPEQVALAA